MLLLSDKQKYEDILWFTLLHEIAHIVNGDYAVDFSNKEENEIEMANLSFIDLENIKDIVKKMNSDSKIYEYIISNFEINNDITSDRSQTVISFLDNKKGSPYDASLLFCTFCRSIGIPALPIAGVVIDKQKKTYIHWWAEFYIEAFGWIPVDIGMAMSVPFENEIKDKKEYYFGNIDSFRISFSHGEKEILQMVANSKMYSHERSFAFKRFWEETLGIDAYTCFWYTPQIISIN